MQVVSSIFIHAMSKIEHFTPSLSDFNFIPTHSFMMNLEPGVVGILIQMLHVELNTQQSLILSSLITQWFALIDDLHGLIPISTAEYFVLATLHICTIFLQAAWTLATTNSLSECLHILSILHQWDYRLCQHCDRSVM